MDEERFLKNSVAGCKTISSKTMINSQDSEIEKRRKLANEIKALGNDCFKREEFSRAVEFYTSAILQDDNNPIIFTNRAQVLN